MNYYASFYEASQRRRQMNKRDIQEHSFTHESPLGSQRFNLFPKIIERLPRQCLWHIAPPKIQYANCAIISKVRIFLFTQSL
jgi:hypothetical protein